MKLWRPYTDEDIAYLTANYPRFGAKRCAEHLRRSEAAISVKASLLKLTHEARRSDKNDLAAPRPPLPPVTWLTRGAKPAQQPEQQPKPSAVYDSGFIRPIPLSRLMGGKA